MAKKKDPRDDFGLSPKKWDPTSLDMSSKIVRSQEKGKKATKRLVRMITFVLVATVIGFPLYIYFAGTQISRLYVMTEDNYNPSYRVRYADLGKSVITTWYEGKPPIITLGDNVVWPSESSSVTGGEVVSPYTPSEIDRLRLLSESQGEPVNEEINLDPSLTVEDVAFLRGEIVDTSSEKKGNYYQENLIYTAIVGGVRYNVGLSIAISTLTLKDSEPVLVSVPTILAPDDVTPDTGYVSKPPRANAKISDAGVQQIAAWAKAYTANDASQLKQLTQDKSSENFYIGVPGGWRFVEDSTKIMWSVTNMGHAVVQVEWQMKMQDTTFSSGDGEITIVGPTQTQRMEVIVEGYDTGLPAISAWGPVGSGLTLAPYDNAVPSSEVIENPEDDLEEGQEGDAEELTDDELLDESEE